MALSGSLIDNSQQGNVYPKRQALDALDDGKTLLLLKPRGCCRGVVRAIDSARTALHAFAPPTYVRTRVADLTQPALSLDDTKDIIAGLRERFPHIKGPAAQDICYATENRQVAVKQVASDADLLLVVGSDNSSNSNRLVEVARNLGTSSHLIDSFQNIKPEWLDGVKTIALTAGASAPECLVEEVVEFLGTRGFKNVKEVEVMPENVRFGLPPEIVEAIASAPTAVSAE